MLSIEATDVDRALLVIASRYVLNGFSGSRLKREILVFRRGRVESN